MLTKALLAAFFGELGVALVYEVVLNELFQLFFAKHGNMIFSYQVHMVNDDEMERQRKERKKETERKRAPRMQSRSLATGKEMTKVRPTSPHTKKRR